MWKIFCFIHFILGESNNELNRTNVLVPWFINIVTIPNPNTLVVNKSQSNTYEETKIDNFNEEQKQKKEMEIDIIDKYFAF